MRSRRHAARPRPPGPVPAIATLAVLVASVTLAACGGAQRAGGPSSTASSATTAPSATSTSTSTSPPSGATGREQIPAFSHVFVVIMENEGRQSALSTPAVAALARRYASATDWYAVAHPSLPNYLAMVSGSTWGVTSDCTSCYQRGPDLGAQLSAAGITWGAYLEGVPGPCFLEPQSADGSYAEKHNPFAYFHDVRDVTSVCAHLQPLSALMGLLAPGAPAPAVPRFVWVTPNLCNDGHDCGPATSGPWLAGFVDSVTASAAWADGGVLVVTWDEGAGGDTTGIDPATGAVTATAGGGNVLTLVIGPHVRAGLTVSTPFDHYALLRTIEDAFDLPLLGAAADRSTMPMSAFFAGGATATAATATAAGATGAGGAGP